MPKITIHKKYLLYGAAVTSLLVLVFIVLYKTNVISTKVTYDGTKMASEEEVLELVKNEISKDTDNDGLMDWEEALWKTSPTNPDSDNDGTTDGEEIKQNRNPAVPYPDDEINMPNVNTTNQEKATEETIKEITAAIENEETLTGKAIKAKTVLYMIDGRSNSNDIQSNKITDEIKKKTDALITRDIETIIANTETQRYTIEDIRTADATIDSYQNYKNELINLFSEYQKNYPTENDAKLIKEVFIDKRATKIADLDKKIKGYIELSDNLINMTVPDDETLLSLHLNMANFLPSLAYSLENIKYIEKDPLRSIIGLSQFETYFKASVYAIADTLKYVNQKLTTVQ